MGATEEITFLDYLLSARLRFLQERLLGLDIYHSGYLGIAVFCLTVASATVFLLAIFQLISKLRHAAILLTGLGVLAVLVGTSTSYLNFKALQDGEEGADKIVNIDAGTLPVSREQQAAVIALPLYLGGATLAANVVGCLYLALFWRRSSVAQKSPRS